MRNNQVESVLNSILAIQQQGSLTSKLPASSSLDQRRETPVLLEGTGKRNTVTFECEMSLGKLQSWKCARTTAVLRLLQQKAGAEARTRRQDPRHGGNPPRSISSSRSWHHAKLGSSMPPVLFWKDSHRPMVVRRGLVGIIDDVGLRVL